MPNINDKLQKKLDFLHDTLNDPIRRWNFTFEDNFHLMNLNSGEDSKDDLDHQFDELLECDEINNKMICIYYEEDPVGEFICNHYGDTRVQVNLTHPNGKNIFCWKYQIEGVTMYEVRDYEFFILLDPSTKNNLMERMSKDGFKIITEDYIESRIKNGHSELVFDFIPELFFFRGDYDELESKQKELGLDTNCTYPVIHSVNDKLKDIIMDYNPKYLVNAGEDSTIQLLEYYGFEIKAELVYNSKVDIDPTFALPVPPKIIRWIDNSKSMTVIQCDVCANCSVMLTTNKELATYLSMSMPNGGGLGNIPIVALKDYCKILNEKFGVEIIFNGEE